MPQPISHLASALSRRPLLLLACLYAALGAVAALAMWSLPEPFAGAVRALTGGRGLGVLEPGGLGRQAAVAPPQDVAMWAIASVAMVGAGLLALPVAWLYTITRQKRGYRQSVVHTLVLLPVVVSGVVVLVKFSLPLAFSLAGIVAAVRFRTTLEDSKDAVYVFVATGIGLSAGVEISAAATLSLVFNLATLLLFRCDFGRNPARLEGEIAEERLRRALALANRTGEFVARLDREILGNMAPEQLEALADRAWKRHMEAGAGPEGGEGTQYDCLLRVRTDGTAGARLTVETVLSTHAKRWHFERAETVAEGGQVVEYAVRLKKSVQATAFLEAVRAESAAGLLSVELK